MSSTPSPPDIRGVERAAYDLWVAPETEELDGWILRHAFGLTGRANSVWPNAEGTLPLGDKIERAEAWYAERRLPSRFQVTDGSLPDGVEQELVARGYRRAGDAVSVETALLSSGGADGTVEISREPDDAWLARWTEARSFDRLDVARALLTGSPGRTAFARVDDVAVGRAVAVGDWLGITSMATRPAARRHGHGRSIVRALIAWGASLGCKRGILQVEAGNEAARALYAGFGFAPHHEYRYLVGP